MSHVSSDPNQNIHIVKYFTFYLYIIAFHDTLNLSIYNEKSTLLRDIVTHSFSQKFEVRIFFFITLLPLFTQHNAEKAR